MGGKSASHCPHWMRVWGVPTVGSDVLSLCCHCISGLENHEGAIVPALRLRCAIEWSARFGGLRD